MSKAAIITILIVLCFSVYKDYRQHVLSNALAKADLIETMKVLNHDCTNRLTYRSP